MARKGDVFAVRRPVGFSGHARRLVVVLQASRFNQAFTTVVVAPIEPATPVYQGFPLAIPASAEETGAGTRAVVVVPAATSLPRSRLEPIPTAQLTTGTLALVDAALADLFDL